MMSDLIYWWVAIDAILVNFQDTHELFFISRIEPDHEKLSTEQKAIFKTNQEVVNVFNHSSSL